MLTLVVLAPLFLNKINILNVNSFVHYNNYVMAKSPLWLGGVMFNELYVLYSSQNLRIIYKLKRFGDYSVISFFTDDGD